jgi:hypothetical protein
MMTTPMTSRPYVGSTITDGLKRASASITEPAAMVAAVLVVLLWRRGADFFQQVLGDQGFVHVDCGIDRRPLFDRDHVGYLSHFRVGASSGNELSSASVLKLNHHGRSALLRNKMAGDGIRSTPSAKTFAVYVKILIGTRSSSARDL